MRYKSKFKSDELDFFFKAVLALENEEQCYRFFEDVATAPELKELEQRLLVASMLQNEATYTTISEKTGASTATISRVKRALSYGEGGYPLVLKRLAQDK